MASRIQLILVGTAPPVQHFVFGEASTCTIGRSPDCTVALPATLEYCDVSRRHCALKIDPPFVHVRDLGSLNGTFINNDRIGSRLTNKGEDTTEEPEWFRLRDGDQLRLGQNAILLLDVREFVADENEESKDSVGSGTYNACPD
jgi:pSer/pThr/pTyr-binding forkhead associated (FHA) protein